MDKSYTIQFPKKGKKVGKVTLACWELQHENFQQFSFHIVWSVRSPGASGSNWPLQPQTISCCANKQQVRWLRRVNQPHGAGEQRRLTSSHLLLRSAEDGQRSQNVLRIKSDWTWSRRPMGRLGRVVVLMLSPAGRLLLKLLPSTDVFFFFLFALVLYLFIQPLMKQVIAT